MYNSASAYDSHKQPTITPRRCKGSMLVVECDRVDRVNVGLITVANVGEVRSTGFRCSLDQVMNRDAPRDAPAKKL